MASDVLKRETPYTVNIGPLLVAMREQGLTQQELAEKAGLHENTISVALRHGSASLRTYLVMCDALSVPFEDVVMRSRA